MSLVWFLFGFSSNEDDVRVSSVVDVSIVYDWSRGELSVVGEICYFGFDFVFGDVVEGY